MSEIPQELRYAKTHEWAKLEDGVITVGITDHAQSLLGDLVYVEVPELEAEAKASEEVGVVESVKAASDIYSPVSGEVIEVNEELASTPELVNEDPYGAGWLMKIKPHDEEEMRELLDADAYEELVDAEH